MTFFPVNTKGLDSDGAASFTGTLGMVAPTSIWGFSLARDASGAITTITSDWERCDEVK